MKTLNLVDLDKSDIKYQIINYPDGQRDISIEPFWKNDILQLEYRNGVQIKSRLNNAEDLLMIVCATKALRNLKVKEIHLYTPYFLGSRSDRQFEEGSNNYLKDVICPIINSLNFDSVTVLDPHSDVLEACLNNFKKKDNSELVKSCFSGLMIKNNTIKNPGQTFMDAFLENIILVSPDAGASKKIYKLAEQIGYKGDIITCSKNRAIDGKLTKCVVPLGQHNYIKPEHLQKDLIIIDDIVDGGGTFINIVKEIKSNKYKGKIYLIVTHGIFSKGFEELSKYFDGIYCTNSYQDLNPNDLSNLGNKHLGEFVKQLNVF